MNGEEANARPGAGAPDRGWRMRWGANLMYFAVIVLMYFNTQPLVLDPWLWALAAVVVPLVIAGVV
jgi:hypothetical protein